MKKIDLQNLLSQPYKPENWKQIVQFVFPNVSILSSPKEFLINNEKIKKFRQIGNVRLNDGKNLALFELLLNDTVNIHRNRVELNNEISKYIDQEQIHGVLSVFEQGTDDYRFTFSARSTEFDEEESDFVQNKTDTKRYTYVLGKNESCKTPADRFYKLSENKSEIDINAIQNAFSVEQLSKEFFDKYKKQFEKFWKYIDSKKEEYKSVFVNGQGEREVKIRNFTKKLLGRIVFLHFLQKKGWMGCPENDLWGSGDKKFMQTLFKDFTNKDQFHSKCLVELFYNTLNTKRDDYLFKCEGLEGVLNNSKIPYLNGGLFDSDKLESTKIDFPESYFQDLFDFFDQYNFTIDENDPNDHEVGIDPEMLGHIFENLLEDNKDKGAFYTPKVIVQYMCQESLIEYLVTKLKAETSGKVKQAVEDLIRNRLKKRTSDLDLVEPIAQALHDVKICDPAIGSGAFPIGILNVIYQVIEELYNLQQDTVARVWNISDTEWQPHLVKKSIIQHSIYGVDIESGAVDIARLRFWLALVVDELEPLPLPNLDYKIMQGNSLLESFEGIDLSQISDAAAYEAVYESQQLGLFGERKKKVKTSLKYEDVKTLMDSYYNANDPETKKNLHKRIDEQALIHIRMTLSKHNREIQKKVKKLEKKIRWNEAAVRTSEQKEKIRTNSKAGKALIKFNTELSQYKDKEIKLAQLSNSNERPFFLWHLFFQEVFDKGGFDIVIGNPPYIGEKGNERIFQEVQKSNLGGRFYTRWMDYFYFFFHLGIDLLNDNGTLAYITTNYFFTSTGGITLRKDLNDRSTIHSLVNFNELKIFESATGQHNAITILKKNKTDEKEAKNINIKISGTANNFKLDKILNYKSSHDADYFAVTQDLIFEGNDFQIRIQGKGQVLKESNSIGDVLQKMKENTNALSEIAPITMGVVSLSDKVSNNHIKKFNVNHSKGEGIYVLSHTEAKQLKLSENDFNKFIRPFYKNSDIERYKSEPKNTQWLIYIKDQGEPISLPKPLKGHFEKYKTIIKGLKDNFLKNAIAASVVKKWYKNGNYFVLFTPKKESYFIGEKIIAPYRSKQNIFGYNNIPFFGSKDVAYILPGNPDYSLKYLNCILNSKLIYHWLYHKGKRKGETLELYKAPLSQIPIKKASDDIQSIFISKFNELAEISKENKSYNSIIRNLDFLVYALYELTYEDIAIIEDIEISSKSYDEYINMINN
tara:strand:- start:5884 stop:9504 length:3621 start_codon:yes stop_codon:yes gene_type:complete